MVGLKIKNQSKNNLNFNYQSILDGHIGQNGDVDDDYPHCPVWERRKLFMMKNPRGDKYSLMVKMYTILVLLLQ
jgi:hypothetical protein